jgi:hypothetical protein
MINILAWLKNRMSTQSHAMWLYRRGMVHAKLHKNRLAVADYTTVVEMEGVSADLRAMALYNRALVRHTEAADESQAIDDLKQILEMADAPEQIKTEARRKLVRMQRTSDRPTPRGPVVKSRSPAGTHARTDQNAAIESAE